MKHSYFRQLGTKVHALPEGERAQRVLHPARLCADVRSSVPGVSLFTLKEVQLQKDLGYRNSSFPDTGGWVGVAFTFDKDIEHNSLLK